MFVFVLCVRVVGGVGDWIKSYGANHDTIEIPKEFAQILARFACIAFESWHIFANLSDIYRDECVT